MGRAACCLQAARVVLLGRLGGWGRYTRVLAWGWAASQEEGALSSRHHPSWAERGPRKLGKLPSACQAAKSGAAVPIVSGRQAGPMQEVPWG